MIGDFISLSFKSAKNRKIRSWLTILGVIIGVAAIIGLITVSSGLENAITDQFNKLGTNRLFIYPKQVSGGFNLGQDLTTDDVETAERMSDFKWVTPYLMEGAKAEFNKVSHYRQIMAVPADNIEERWGGMDIGLIKGRYWAQGEKFSAIIGTKAAKDLFDTEIRINNHIVINGQKFKVIGIMKEIGNPEDDSAIYIPLDTARTLFNKKTQVNLIDIVLKNPVDINNVAKKLTRNLKNKRGNENFEVQTPQQLLQQMGDILKITQIIFISIASISLVVGGIGIMNSMFTSVLERRYEIGIMKAIGASNTHILMLFIIEAALFGLIGGIIGAILGSLAAYSVKIVASQLGFNIIRISLNAGVIIFSLCFAMFVGIVSGFIPAYQAAKLKPVEALRYE